MSVEVLQGGAWATDAYPSRPVKLMVGYAAGGPVDAAARIYAQHLARVLQQPVVVENRGGAGGTLAPSATAKADPDGYTLCFIGGPALTIAPLIQRSFPFSPLKDFTYIGIVVNYANVLLVSNEFAAKSVGELVDSARLRPSSVSFASAGVGTSNHLSGELLAQRTKVSLVHVPYKGNAPAMGDVMTGRVNFIFDITASAIGHVNGGKMRALAVTSQTRNPALPNVPTMIESGVKDFDVTGWYAVVGPQKLPADVVDRLVKAQKTIGDDPVFRQRMEQGGYELNVTGPQPMVDRVQRDLALWGGVVKAAKIEKE